MYPLFIVVPIHNAEKYLPDFLATLKKQTYQQYELVIFDDGSEDDSVNIIMELFPRTHILRGDGTCWWSTSVNEGIRFALNNNCELVLTLNVDLVLHKDYLRNMIIVMNNRKNLILGSAVYDIETRLICDIGANYNWKTAKLSKNIFKLQNDLSDLKRTNVLGGRGLLIPRNAFELIGLFDQVKLPQYAADYVFTAKANQNGFELYCNTKAIIYSYIKNTGISSFIKRLSFANFYKYLTHIKSPGNLKVRWYAARQMVPRKYFIQFIILDLLRVIGGYFKTTIYGNTTSLDLQGRHSS